MCAEKKERPGNVLEHAPGPLFADVPAKSGKDSLPLERLGQSKPHCKALKE